MDQKVQYIPFGSKNMENTFPSIPWKDVEEYYMQVTNLEGAVVATTPHYFIEDGTPGEDESCRLHFLNSLGGIDAITFWQTEENYEVKSSTWQKPLSVPLIKSDGGNSRYNVQANDNRKVTAVFQEDVISWVKELMRSPSVWIEWKGVQGQPDDYLPVLLKDATYNTLKVDDRYEYQLTVEFQFSNTDITIRN
ncbi:hypothetical protein [Chitinophaga sancti]|uniref:Uncharacterized protein n=1 Tax=Chitinophaga sancti TaxID=1004 RepID=A0A1K1LYY2_9BACT|nr:hypothetical protein [Chitinophaga sancti]WQD64745.1 hypothetical protein U0033_10090 [Chitinophaga sancti]WQG89633.1 hypothetical protein SR876_32385 [Chitinophaga sancti]SFW16055.1 hypothetical protein SAMN05661012_00326 [Chitinophaga sancti]